MSSIEELYLSAVQLRGQLQDKRAEDVSSVGYLRAIAFMDSVVDILQQEKDAAEAPATEARPDPSKMGIGIATFGMYSVGQTAANSNGTFSSPTSVTPSANQSALGEMPSLQVVEGYACTHAAAPASFVAATSRFMAIQMVEKINAKLSARDTGYVCTHAVAPTSFMPPSAQIVSPVVANKVEARLPLLGGEYVSTHAAAPVSFLTTTPHESVSGSTGVEDLALLDEIYACTHALPPENFFDGSDDAVSSPSSAIISETPTSVSAPASPPTIEPLSSDTYPWTHFRAPIDFVGIDAATPRVARQLGSSVIETTPNSVPAVSPTDGGGERRSFIASSTPVPTINVKRAQTGFIPASSGSVQGGEQPGLAQQLESAELGQYMAQSSASGGFGQSDAGQQALGETQSSEADILSEERASGAEGHGSLAAQIDNNSLENQVNPAVATAAGLVSDTRGSARSFPSYTEFGRGDTEPVSTSPVAAEVVDVNPSSPSSSEEQRDGLTRRFFRAFAKVRNED